jgi:AbrB family looped-hinge helix DNA binding protein
MARVTGKFQITLPKRLVDAYGIRIGDEVEIVAAGDAIAILPSASAGKSFSPEERVRHFDAATRRQAARSAGSVSGGDADRGWTRDELYSRGRPR